MNVELILQIPKEVKRILNSNAETLKTFEYITMVFDERVRVEEAYFNGLNKIQGMLNFIKESDSLSFESSILKVDNSQRSSHNQSLIEQFKAESEEMKIFSRRHQEKLKSCDIFFKESEKGLRNTLLELDKSKEKLSQISKELEDLCLSYHLLLTDVQRSTPKWKERKVGLVAKLKQTEEQKNEIEASYRRELDSMDNQLAEFNLNVKKKYAELQLNEKELRLMAHDIARKQLVFEVNHIRNIQYDIDNVIKQVDAHKIIEPTASLENLQDRTNLHKPFRFGTFFSKYSLLVLDILKDEEKTEDETTKTLTQQILPEEDTNKIFNCISKNDREAIQSYFSLSIQQNQDEQQAICSVLDNKSLRNTTTYFVSAVLQAKGDSVDLDVANLDIQVLLNEISERTKKSKLQESSKIFDQISENPFNENNSQLKNNPQQNTLPLEQAQSVPSNVTELLLSDSSQPSTSITEKNEIIQSEKKQESDEKPIEIQTQTNDEKTKSFDVQQSEKDNLMKQTYWIDYSLEQNQAIMLIFLENFRQTGKSMITVGQYNQLVCECFRYLDEIAIVKDITHIMRFMPLSFAIYRTSSVEKIFIQERIRHHQIWVNSDIWETLIFQSVRGDLAKLSPEIASEEMVVRNTIQSNISTIGLNMLKFRSTKTNTKNICAKLAHGYNLPPASISEITLFIENEGNNEKSLTFVKTNTLTAKTNISKGRVINFGIPSQPQVNPQTQSQIASSQDAQKSNNNSATLQINTPSQPTKNFTSTYVGSNEQNNSKPRFASERTSSLQTTSNLALVKQAPLNNQVDKQIKQNESSAISPVQKQPNSAIPPISPQQSNQTTSSFDERSSFKDQRSIQPPNKEQVSEKQTSVPIFANSMVPISQQTNTNPIVIPKNKVSSSLFGFGPNTNFALNKRPPQ